MTTAGVLAGRTILRFAHAFDTGGGTERYLDDLDRVLLERNAMTIVRLHLTHQRQGELATKHDIGQGVLIRLSLPIIAAGSSTGPDANERSLRVRVREFCRDHVLYNPVVWRAFGQRYTKSRRLEPAPGQAIGAGKATRDLLRSYPVDLVMLHFCGVADADEVVEASREADVPVAILHHYANERFLHAAIRKHVLQAAGVAGVNQLAVPDYLKERFVNLSDGIDIEFFRRAHAREVRRDARPVILLPARVVPEKGQMDLVHAARELLASGHSFSIAFAGRLDESEFVAQLKTEIARARLDDRVLFLGDLSVEDLRDWYAASSIVAFPTYHHEGLGRAIVEAEAMEVPVVAYATGGVPEAMIEGETGFLLRTGDVEGLAQSLRQLLESDALRTKMALRGRAFAEERFSLPALAERHEQFYLRFARSARSEATAVGA